jgi:hypothetical protein
MTACINEPECVLFQSMPLTERRFGAFPEIRSVKWINDHRSCNNS